jgi:hypothetical protein
MEKTRPNRSTFFVGLLILTFPVIAQTSKPVPGDNLIVERISNIPASLTESVGRYTEFRTAALLIWHPKCSGPQW